MSAEANKQFYIKTLSGFAPASDAAKAFHQKISLNAIVELPGKRPRNPGHHRKFFAMLKIVLDNQDHYKCMDQLLAVCKLAVGHADVIRTKHGDVAIPKSIAWGKMTQAEFEVLYDNAVQWVTTEVIQGLSKTGLDEAVEQELLRF